MMQSQLFRSASLCHRYWRCAPSTWSTTQPQSRSDHVPGNTTTPNFMPRPTDGVDAVRTPPPRTSSRRALAPVLELEVVVLDYVVREQPAAHRIDAFARLALGGRVQRHLDVLADADVGDLTEAKRCEPLPDRDPLRVVDHRLRHDNYSRDHFSFLGFFGKSGLPTRR